MPDHQHEIVFIGMVNVNRDNYLQGVVDVWRCRSCKRIFCDDKRYGEPLKPAVGFEDIADDEQWGILTCTDSKSVFMVSMGVKPGKKIKHACKDGIERELTVGEDWAVSEGPAENIHRIFLVKDHINKNIEAGFYKLRLMK